MLLLDPSPKILAGFSTAGADLQAAGLDVIAIATDADHDPGFPLLGDGAGKIRAALREMTGQRSAPSLALLLDRNQRLIESMADGDVAWAMARWRTEPAAEPAVTLGEVAPALLIPNVLSPEQCRALIARWENEGHDEGKVHSIVDGVEVERVHETLKKRRDHRLKDDTIRKPLLAQLGRRLAPELDKAFSFRNFRFDRLLIACYEAERGDFFRRHRDNQSPETASRRFALTLNLNSDEYEGGELIFPEYGNHRYKPPAGGAILFSCSLLHEALPVKSGRRFALLTFLRDPT